MTETVNECRGFCRKCGLEHHLSSVLAINEARSLMAVLEHSGRIDFALPAKDSSPHCSTSSLFGVSRGKMFGVMVASTQEGGRRVVHAFSGQYNGMWEVPGWAGPLFDLQDFHRVHDQQEQHIQALGRQMDATAKGTNRYRALQVQRKQASQKLMEDLHGLYRVRNFCGQVAGLQEIFPEGQGIPTGTGDCCAPKLLQYAAVHGLTPLAIAEFYWGKTNVSGRRQHGVFYPSCQEKCYPLLGFMLCGLQRRGEHD